MVYEVGVVLAHELNADMSLSEQTRRRTERGIESLKNGCVKNLIMSGGHGDLGERYGVSLAEAMRNYAMQQGIPKTLIFEEDLSIETVGQLVFCKQGVIDPQGWKRILVISHNYHIQRVKKLADRIFGEGYHIDFEGVESELDDDEEVLRKETGRGEVFERMFGDITPGDDFAFLRRLLERHEVYSRSPEEFEVKLEKLKQKQETK